MDASSSDSSSDTPKQRAKLIKVKDTATASTSKPIEKTPKIKEKQTAPGKERASKKSLRDPSRAYVETEPVKNTKSATATGETIMRKLEKFAEFEDVSYFVKLQYLGPKSRKRWNSGSDFHFYDENKKENPLPSKAELEMVIRETIQDEFQQQSASRGTPPRSATQGSFASPRRNVEEEFEVGGCQICKRDLGQALKIYCSHEEDKEECQMGVHSACLGFKVSKEKHLEKLPSWYCVLHREAPVMSSKEKPRKKATR